MCILTRAHLCASAYSSSYQIFHAKINPPGFPLSLHVSLVSSAFIHTALFPYSSLISRARFYIYTFGQFHCFPIDLKHRLEHCYYFWKSERKKCTMRTNSKQRKWIIDFFCSFVRSMEWSAYFFQLSTHFDAFFNFFYIWTSNESSLGMCGVQAFLSIVCVVGVGNMTYP